MRILICGPSGVGKTTLAKCISVEYKLEFVSTSSKALWKTYGIVDHEAIIKMGINNPMRAYKFQMDLLDIREKLMERDNFVTDRSPVDNLVYYLMQVAPFVDEKLTVEYIDRCNSLLTFLDEDGDGDARGPEAMSTYLIPIEYQAEMDVERDGFRIPNKIFQQCTQLYFNYCLSNWFGNLMMSNYIYLRDTNFNERWERVKKVLDPAFGIITKLPIR